MSSKPLMFDCCCYDCLSTGGSAAYIMLLLQLRLLRLLRHLLVTNICMASKASCDCRSNVLGVRPTFFRQGRHSLQDLYLCLSEEFGHQSLPLQLPPRDKARQNIPPDLDSPQDMLETLQFLQQKTVSNCDQHGTPCQQQGDREPKEN